MMSSMRLLAALCLSTAAAFIGCSGGNADVKVAYITNGVAPFWDVAEQGAIDGAKAAGVDLVVKMPVEGVADQKRMVQDVLAKGIDGIAISPIDPDGQKDTLNEIGANTLYITQDSDAPNTNRLCYIGMDNYDAGRMCGQLIKEATSLREAK